MCIRDSSHTPPRPQVDVLPGHLEVLEELDEEEDEYAKQRHAARKRQMTAGRASSPDKVVARQILHALVHSLWDSQIGNVCFNWPNLACTTRNRLFSF